MDAEKPPERSPQFTVRTMLLWVAACSVPLAILQAWLPEPVMLLYLAALTGLLSLALAFAAAKWNPAGSTARLAADTHRNCKKTVLAVAFFAATALILLIAVCLAAFALSPGS